MFPLFLLPLIGGGIGAMTNLKHPDQMLKNMGIGAGIGGAGALGASAIPGLLGSGTSAIPGPLSAGGLSEGVANEIMPSYLGGTGPSISDPSLLQKMAPGMYQLSKMLGGGQQPPAASPQLSQSQPMQPVSIPRREAQSGGYGVGDKDDNMTKLLMALLMRQRGGVY